ncbi:hypothetical protein [Hellea balneolensis]|uniref:hypothetical protein n=1 Tax=Hellea balneolensis TaxID=287478 RepID=UPI000479C535|nr:hypothetical protein [Hellea balneolensis]
MPKRSKPWLNYKSNEPVREYPRTPIKKRHLKWALFWLIVGGHIGAHRLYLWDGTKAVFIMAFFFISFLCSLFCLALIYTTLDISEFSEDSAVGIAAFFSVALIFIFELPRLKRRVDFKNKKHLLN